MEARIYKLEACVKMKDDHINMMDEKIETLEKITKNLRNDLTNINEIIMNAIEKYTRAFFKNYQFQAK